MGRGKENNREEDGSVYQPNLPSGVGGVQANEVDASSVATNATSVEDTRNPGLSGCGRGRGRGCG
jgi:hypothetical protein